MGLRLHTSAPLWICTFGSIVWVLECRIADMIVCMESKNENIFIDNNVTNVMMNDEVDKCDKSYVMIIYVPIDFK